MGLMADGFDGCWLMGLMAGGFDGWWLMGLMTAGCWLLAVTGEGMYTTPKAEKGPHSSQDSVDD